MNYNLNADQWDQIKLQFSKWQEVQTRKKELAEENKDICKTAATILEGKSTDASKLFKNMQQKWDGQEPEADMISSLLTQMEANGGSAGTD